MRVLITGGGGQVGPRAGRPARGRAATTRSWRRRGRRSTCADRDSVLGVICANRPDLILHAGAFTAVDGCETEVDLAYQVNALGTRHVADGARRVGAHVVYVSTDYVFDGTKAEPLRRVGRAEPAVGLRPHEAGRRVGAATPRWTVARVSWVCGYHGANMVKTVLRLAGGEGPLRFVDDQRGHPTFADDLAPMLIRLGVERRPGIFHVTNQGAVSWYEFVRDILAAAGGDPGRVEPISTAELDTAPPGPAAGELRAGQRRAPPLGPAVARRLPRAARAARGAGCSPTSVGG